MTKLPLTTTFSHFVNNFFDKKFYLFDIQELKKSK